ncbi:MAG: hypothetical protein ACLPPF_14730 [Rhodomicrobium sp.]
MIGLPLFSKRKRDETAGKPAVPAQPAAPKQRPEKPPRFMGGVPERTQDFLGRQDGERIGFRKPVEG